MGRKRHTAERIIGKLRTAEVELGEGGLVRPRAFVSSGSPSRPTTRWRKEVRGSSARPSQAPERAREGKHPAQEASGRPGARQRNPQGSQLGKF